jgi:hypothetical protein
LALHLDHVVMRLRTVSSARRWQLQELLPIGMAKLLS